MLGVGCSTYPTAPPPPCKGSFPECWRTSHQKMEGPSMKWLVDPVSGFIYEFTLEMGIRVRELS